MRVAAIGLILCAGGVAAGDTTLSVPTDAAASAAAAGEAAGKAAARPLDLKGAAAADAAFRRWARAWAADSKGALSRWGWAQLDDDAKPERFAVVCGGDDSDDDQTTLIEDVPGKRWAIASTMDGRNSCEANDKPKWERDAPSELRLADSYHGGEDTTWVARRAGAPAIVLYESNLHHFHGESECSDDTIDFDRLERHYTTCAMTKAGDIVQTSDARSAQFIIDGAGGKYRYRSGDGDVPDFDVAVRGAGKRLMVEAKLARPARVGEAVEVWTVGSAGRTLSWSARWDGARWQLSGLMRAPRELPPVEGDAGHLTLPIVRRSPADADNPPAELTPLTLVAVSADGQTRVATSDLKPQDAATLGHATTFMPLAAKPQP